nr:dna repair protein reca like 2, mitochondrial [Quercus suber]
MQQEKSQASLVTIMFKLWQKVSSAISKPFISSRKLKSTEVFLSAGYYAYLDIENTMDPSLAESMGGHTENILILCPSSAEILPRFINTLTIATVDVIVVDALMVYLSLSPM